MQLSILSKMRMVCASRASFTLIVLIKRSQMSVVIVIVVAAASAVVY